MSPKPIKFVLLAFYLIVIFSGCATTKLPHEIVATEQDIAKYRDLPSQSAIDKVENIYNNQKAEQLNFYAPRHYTTAEKALSEAKTLLAADAPQNQITDKAAIADAVLKNGELVMRRVKERLEPELSVKNKLDLLETPLSYPNEYGGLLHRLNEIIIEIEQGNLLSTAASRDILVQDMQDLKRRTLHFNAMNEPQEIIKRVKYRGGDKSAPITFQEATTVIARAEQFIHENPDNESAIQQISDEALFAAKRALYITDATNARIQQNPLTPEQMVLEEEYRLLRVSRQIEGKDFRDHPIEVQSELIAKAAKGKMAELNNKDELVFALRDTLIKVRDSSNQLNEVSAAAESLNQEKKHWLTKENEYQTLISELKNKLSRITAQLDDTQDTIVDITTENIDLTDLVEMKISEAKNLKNTINDNQKMIDQLQSELIAKQQEKATQEIQISALEQQLAQGGQIPTQSENIDSSETFIDPEEHREKVSKAEAMQAIESAKELIKTYQSTDDSNSLTPNSEAFVNAE